MGGQARFLSASTHGKRAGQDPERKPEPADRQNA